jgi:hypothetical protein
MMPIPAFTSGVAIAAMVSLLSGTGMPGACTQDLV